jgi:DNA transposition AAA+ family ATPase
MNLTRTHKQQITEAVNSWIDDKNPARSGNKLAEKAGINQAYISKIKNSTYEIEVGSGRVTQISDAYFHRIADAIGIRFDGQLHWDFIGNFKTIQRACRKAQKNAIREVIQGWTGMGKTYALESYAMTNDYVLYVKATMNMSSKDLLDTILEKMGVHDSIRGNHSKLEMIKRVINQRKGWLIIIDETEVVRAGIYSVLKDISDWTQNKAGFIICGMDLINKLDKLASKNKAGFPQLRRRFFGNKIVTASKLSESEIVQVCEFEDISNKGAQNMLAQYVTDLDMLSQYVADIKDWQKQNGKKITGQEVAQLFSLNTLSKSA